MNSRILVFIVIIVTASFIFAMAAHAQAQTTLPATAAGTSTLDNTLSASEADEPSRKFVKFNEFEGKYATIRFGFGFLYEYDAYAQNDESKKQMTVHPDERVRDARLLFSGRFKFFKRRVTYSMGLMYDGANKEWHARQTGLMIDFQTRIQFKL